MAESGIEGDERNEDGENGITKSAEKAASGKRNESCMKKSGWLKMACCGREEKLMKIFIEAINLYQWRNGGIEASAKP
jgi:hypothetical protein